MSPSDGDRDVAPAAWRRRRRQRRACLGAAAALAAAVHVLGAAEAGQRADEPLATALARARAAAAAAGGRLDGHDEAQTLYDAARDLQTALPTTPPARCAPVVRVIGRYAAGLVAAAEWFDRQEAAESVQELSRLQRQRLPGDSRLEGCARGDASSRRAGLVLEPGWGEAFTGTVRVRVPAAAASLRLVVDGRELGPVTVARPGVRDLRVAAGRPHVDRLELRVRDAGGRVLHRELVEQVTRLSRAAFGGVATTRRDRALDMRLEELARSFPGTAAISIVDLGRGRRGSWNADSRFPAASTVKLGLMVAALATLRTRAEREAVRHDLASIARWSSNLAANRLLLLVGDGDPGRGRRRVEAALRRLGAARSTYPGPYRVGTSATGRGLEPPLVSQRVTTAADLGAALETLHRTAGGGPAAAGVRGLDRRDARLVLGLLLRSEPGGANAGVLAGLPAGTLVARKNGWITDAQHTAAIVYGATGAVVCVVLTYGPGLTLATARQLGARITPLCRPRP